MALESEKDYHVRDRWSGNIIRRTDNSARKDEGESYGDSSKRPLTEEEIANGKRR